MIEVQGKVTKAVRGGFEVELKNGHKAHAYLAGKIKMKNILVKKNDLVTIEFSPDDLTHGRIIFRKKKCEIE